MTSKMFKFDDMTPPQFLHAARKAVNKVRNDPKYYREYLSALLAWVDDNPVRFGPDSAMGRLTQIITRFDDIDDDDIGDNDVVMFMRIIFEFFRSVTAEDISNVENWELTTNMSPNLLGLFGRPKSDVKVDTDWEAPDKPGLGNSDPAFATEKNARPIEKAEGKTGNRDSTPSKSVGFSEAAEQKTSHQPIHHDESIDSDAKGMSRNSSAAISRNSSTFSRRSARSDGDEDEDDEVG
jgi:hypothetical protein